MKKGLILGLLCVGFVSVINAQTKGVMTVTVTTSSVPTSSVPSAPGSGFRGGNGGNRTWTPENCMAIWIEDNTGKFVKTITVNATRYQIYLTSWKNSTSAAGSTFNKVDAVTGATNLNHGTRTSMWDGKDFKGNLVPDGTYKICMEITETNSTGTYASFTITKGKVAEVQKPANKPGFSAVLLKWEPGTSTITKK